MKKLIFVIAIGIITSCASKVDNPANSEEIENQIAEYKKQVVELNKKINELEKDLQSYSDESVQGTPVSIKELAFEEFNHYIEVNGVVEAINAAYISPEINGQIKEIYVEEGQYVKKGQLLIKINSSVIESTLKEVETSLELAITVYEKQKQLWEKNIGSELDYLQAKNNKESLESRLETLQAQIDMAMVKAPIDGIVDEVFVKDGELAIPGMQMIQLVNLNNLYVNADVSEAYITKVKKGEMVVLEFPSYPDINMNVPVHRIGNVVKSANRTFKVQLKIKNENDQIKPNVLARIKINDYTTENALLVSSLIVKQDLKGSYVFVANADNTAKKAYIETGMSYMDLTMVTTGLSVGDRVIVKGYNQVSNGSKLEIVK
ncbi:MAG: efflux RND transporter periplasmic adaptor subunit [Bacteroidales bacterium]|nr:efflux RND transporter periplasmic adaptor subunit [Bacteroidales bacterium]